MPRFEQNDLNPWLSNWRPLSEMIVLGMLYLQTMFFHTKFCILASVIVARASTSTYFMKLSIATSRNFTCFFLCDKGPTLSIPHCANGHGDAMVLIFSPGTR